MNPGFPITYDMLTIINYGGAIDNIKDIAEDS